MRLRRRRPQMAAATSGRPRQGGEGGSAGPARWKKAEKEIAALRRRVVELEDEVQELRQLSRRVAEITDVVAEVLLPAEDRDEDRLRELLARYETGL